MKKYIFRNKETNDCVVCNDACARELWNTGLYFNEGMVDLTDHYCNDLGEVLFDKFGELRKDILIPLLEEYTIDAVLYALQEKQMKDIDKLVDFGGERGLFKEEEENVK